MSELAHLIHILGVILWIGGGITGALLAASATTREKPIREAIFVHVRTALLFVSTPGLVLAWVGALAMLIPNWSLYVHEGWSHAKLTLGIILSGVSGVLSARIRKGAEGKETTAGLLAALGMSLAIGAVLALVLVIFRPF